MLSIAGIVCEEFQALKLPINPTIIRVMRVLRIARVLKLLKMAKGIRSLLDTVGQALPQVGNLGLLFFLLFFIFAALGVELFGKLGAHKRLFASLTLAIDVCRMFGGASMRWFGRTRALQNIWNGRVDTVSHSHRRQLEWHHEGHIARGL
jgi:hypothetical protein